MKCLFLLIGETTEDDTFLYIVLYITCIQLLRVLYLSSVSTRHSQNAFDPPFLSSKVALSLCPCARAVQLALSCAHPPYVQQYVVVTRRVKEGLSGVLVFFPLLRLDVGFDEFLSVPCFMLFISVCMDRRSLSISI